MDKVFSARVDDAILSRITWLAKELGATKKAVIEEAVRRYAQEVEASNGADILEQTCGAWERDEPPEQTVMETRAAFRRSLAREHT